MTDLKWVDIKSNSGAKCRGECPDKKIIPKGNKSLHISGWSAAGSVSIFLCEEHGVKLLEQANSLLKSYKQNPNAPWNQPTEYGERPGDICCMRACGGKCYEHDHQNYKDGVLI